jgi:hypothetical protein
VRFLIGNVIEDAKITLIRRYVAYVHEGVQGDLGCNCIQGCIRPQHSAANDFLASRLPRTLVAGATNPTRQGYSSQDSGISSDWLVKVNIYCERFKYLAMHIKGDNNVRHWRQ